MTTEAAKIAIKTGKESKEFRDIMYLTTCLELEAGRQTKDIVSIATAALMLKDMVDMYREMENETNK